MVRTFLRNSPLVLATLLLLTAFAPGALRTTRAAGPEGTPASPLKVQKFSHYTDFTGALHVVGEVKNIGGKNLTRIEIGAHILNAQGKEVAVNFAYSCVEILHPGQVSPFHVGVGEVPASAKGYELSVGGYQTTAKSSTAAFRASATTTTRAEPYYHIKGTAKNISANPYGLVEVCTAMYNPAGTKVIRAGFTSTDPLTLGPGKSGKFDWQIYKDDYPKPAGKVKVWVQGIRK